MHELRSLSPQERSALSAPLDALIYHGQMISRWANSADTTRWCGQYEVSDQYLKLIFDELDKVKMAQDALLAVLKSAPVQDVPRETKGEAA